MSREFPFLPPVLPILCGIDFFLVASLHGPIGGRPRDSGPRRSSPRREVGQSTPSTGLYIMQALADDGHNQFVQNTSPTRGNPWEAVSYTHLTLPTKRM